MINEQGGINGRKINFITRDDGYSPPKTGDQEVRRLLPKDYVAGCPAPIDSRFSRVFGRRPGKPK